MFQPPSNPLTYSIALSFSLSPLTSYLAVIIPTSQSEAYVFCFQTILIIIQIFRSQTCPELEAAHLKRVNSMAEHSLGKKTPAWLVQATANEEILRLFS